LQAGPIATASRVAVEFPAVARAYDGIAFDEAVGEQAAIMWAGVWQNYSGAVCQDGHRNCLPPIVRSDQGLARARDARLGHGQPIGCGTHSRGIGSGNIFAEVIGDLCPNAALCHEARVSLRSDSRPCGP
jgi:hypothetical protein